LAEELVKEYGEPDDYSHSRISCVYNIFAMCCSNKMPRQESIYKALENNKNERHLSSIANFNEFNKEF